MKHIGILILAAALAGLIAPTPSMTQVKKSKFGKFKLKLVKNLTLVCKSGRSKDGHMVGEYGTRVSQITIRFTNRLRKNAV